MGNLWFGTDGGGVSRYDGKSLPAGQASFTNFTTEQGLANNTVLSITEDKRGNLWFGTQGGGVSRYDGKSFTNYTTEQGLANNNVRSIIEDKMGNLWFGTHGGGVSRYDGNRVEAIERGEKIPLSDQQDLKRENGKLVKSFTNFTTAQGLANNNVRCITEDKMGNLWFGTQGGGVSRFDGKSLPAGQARFTNFTTAQGLPDDFVTQITITKEQGIAIGTNFGVGVLVSFSPKHTLSGAVGLSTDGKQNNIPAQNNMSNEELKNYSPVIEIYNSSTGYPVKDVNAGQNCMFSDSKGIIWMGTGSDKTALVRFDYAALNKNNKPPAVFIQSIKINNENICWYNLVGSRESGVRSEKENNDSATVAQQEIMTFGTVLSEQKRDTLRQRFSGIKLDGITKFYPLPENLVLPYEHNNVTIDFAAIEPLKTLFGKLPIYVGRL